VFSITILVMQLASTQYSSRVLRTFLEDRLTKLSMAVFVASFVFALVLLPEIRDGASGHEPFVPALSTFAAFLLALLSVGLFVQYIDHMAHSIRAIHVVRRVGEETRQSIERWCPHTVSLSGPGATPEPPPPHRVIPHAGRAGVVTAIDEGALLELASRAEVVIALVPEVGHFVPRGAPLFRLSGPGAVPLEALRDAVVFADERTLHQDPAFGLRQLVDVAERALSPGINDPTTAVQALDQLHDLLRLLATREFPPVERRDADGRVRVLIPRPDWPAHVRLALDEVRHFGQGSIQVARRLEALLRDLAAVAPAHRQPVIAEQQRLLEQDIARHFETRVERELASQPSMEGHGSANERPP
jgi:uncharacterized membrane protein